MSGKYLLAAQAGQLHGEIKTQDITISGTWPTALPTDQLAGRKDFSLLNKTGVSIWLGGPDVNQYNGQEVVSEGTWAAQLGRASVYAITAGTTVSGVRIMEIA